MPRSSELGSPCCTRVANSRGDARHEVFKAARCSETGRAEHVLINARLVCSGVRDDSRGCNFERKVRHVKITIMDKS